MSPTKLSHLLQATPSCNAAPLLGSVGEGLAPGPRKHRDSHWAAPGVGSAACASTGVLLSAINCARHQLLRYSRGGGDLTFLTEDTGPNVL